MQIVTSDETIRVQPGTSPNYNANNPIWKISKAVETNKMAAEIENYDVSTFQYVYHFNHLKLYGPQGGDADRLQAEEQDNKNDFQKQNIKDFTLGNTFIVRGWVQVGEGRYPFVKFSYRAGAEPLFSAQGAGPANLIKLWFKIESGNSDQTIDVPYNGESDRYEVELWGVRGQPVDSLLDTKGKAALGSGHILIRPDLITGDAADFARESISDATIAKTRIDHCMHPILPLTIQFAWANAGSTVWDNNSGRNYRLSFSMAFRGWNNFLKAGVSGNPHGGVGFLEYRNLFSNYFEHKERNELDRPINTWNFNATGQKGNSGFENFMAVDYMDLHILRPSCGIGIHRHRDNQEVFLMMEGQGLMIVGDWVQHDNRERCFEVRTLKSGDLALCKSGQLHALLNLTDTDTKLFMFGGYD